MSDTAAKRQAPPGWFIDATLPQVVAAGRSVAMKAFLNTPDPRPPFRPEELAAFVGSAA